MIFQKELIQSLQLHSNSTAIENGSQHITYSHLSALSNSVTNFLLAQKIEKETVIGIQLTDKVDVIAAVIGVVNARCTFVLIDGTLPEQRLKLLLEELNLEYIICAAGRNMPAVIENKATIQKFFYEHILEKSPGSAIVDFPDYEADDSLYIYFTSGSTGVPKGIIGKNSSLLQFIKWELSAFDIQEDSRFSQFVSPYFDAFLRDIFVPLFAGATICLTPVADDFFIPENLIDWIDTNEISVIHCVPSLFRVFNSDELTPENFLHLKLILMSGEKIFPSELVGWYDTFEARIQLVNLYGPTETTMVRSYYKIVPADVRKEKIPIGEAIAETELLVANKDLKPTAKLMPGDLYVVSKYTTKGYLNLPELTHQKFLKINQGTADEKIAFKTGDKARLLSDGQIDLLGREDRQVKLRGIRIELDEIERVIFKSDLVKNAVVIKHTEENNEESLIAFVLRKEQCEYGEALKQMIQDHMAVILPPYMLPSNLLVANEFPLLSNGKINYKELINLLTASLAAKNNAVTIPVNEIENKLLLIWKEILGEKVISTADTFLIAGGNSLGMMRLIGRIYKEFNVRLSLSQLFSNLTIQKQTAFIKQATKDDRLVIKKAEFKTTYNTSSAQQRIFYSYELDKESKAYNLPVAWKIKGDFEIGKVQDVLNQLISRHESLRTQFSIEDDKIVQVVKEPVDFKLEEIDANGQDLAEVISNFIRPFDLSQAPLFRCGIISAAKDEHTIIVDTHHIVCDGLSQMSLYEDFLKLYQGAELKTLPIQYKDYAEWEYSFRETDEYLAHRHFWLKSFEGELPVLNLPVTDQGLKIETGEGGKIVFQLDKSELNSIIEKMKAEDVTTFSSLFSLFFIFLAQLTGQDDIIIGVPTSGRMQEELDGMVGMFIKTMPIRYQINADMTFNELSKDINSHLVQANSKQVYDLADMISQLNKTRKEPLENLFDVMFVFQNFEDSKVLSDFVEFSGYDIGEQASKYALGLYCSESESSFNFQFNYSKNTFSQPAMENMVADFKALVTRFAENSNSRIIEYIDGTAQNDLIIADDFSFNF